MKHVLLVYIGLLQFAGAESKDGQPAPSVATIGAAGDWFRGQPASNASDAEIADWFRAQPPPSVAADILACDDANSTTMEHLSLVELSVASVAMAVVMLTSWYMGLDLESRVGIATVRTVLQLSALGYILEPIFALEDPRHVATVFMALVFMLLVVVLESTSRLTCSYPGIGRHMFVALVGGLSFNVTVVVLIMSPSPLWSPRYTVPLFGMLLGASCTACCPALGKLMSGLQGSAGDNIDFLLANGASRGDATKVIKKTAISTGIIPTLSTMNIEGRKEEKEGRIVAFQSERVAQIVSEHM